MDMKKKKEKEETFIPVQATREIEITEKSEMRQVFDNLDDDRVDDKGFSKLDLHTNIEKVERGYLLRYQEMRNLGILAFAPTLGQQFKRDSVSIKGWGRELKTKMVSADREQKSASGIARLFQPKGGQQQ